MPIFRARIALSEPDTVMIEARNETEALRIAEERGLDMLYESRPQYMPESHWEIVPPHRRNGHKVRAHARQPRGTKRITRTFYRRK